MLWKDEEEKKSRPPFVRYERHDISKWECADVKAEKRRDFFFTNSYSFTYLHSSSGKWVRNKKVIKIGTEMKIRKETLQAACFVVCNCNGWYNAHWFFSSCFAFRLTFVCNLSLLISANPGSEFKNDTEGKGGSWDGCDHWIVIILTYNVVVGWSLLEVVNLRRIFW